MGMKPRTKPKAEDWATGKVAVQPSVEHDHPAVESLCRMSQIIADSPADMASACTWMLAHLFAVLVPSDEMDDAVDDLRNEVLVKACLLEVNKQTKKLSDWIAEGPRYEA